MPIVALVLLVLLAFAGLALDGVHLYLVKRNAQNASDAAALAAGKWLVASGAILNAPPSSSTSQSVSAAHDLASVNGFSTVLNSACDSASSTQFSTTWFDNGAGCASTDFNFRVSVHVPPQGPLPPDCVNIPYNCFQVGVTERVPNFLVGVIGIPVTYVTASAVVLAQPAGRQISTPPPIALYLYEPHASACAPGAKCFDPTQPPQRKQLACVNCPTFWTAPGAGTTVAGIDGKIVSPPGDHPALQSNGDMVIQADTTICDPYGGAICQAGRVTGAEGFGIASGATLYCAGFSAGSPNGLTNCTTTGQTGLAHLAANEVGFSAETWTPTVNTNGLPGCGTLVLNGDTVARSLGGSSDPKCVPPANEPYSIMPGIYRYIVINHGSYEFQPGLYDITDEAPQNAISHGTEGPADFDLCAGTPSCTATAGIWIGHGNNPYVAGSSSRTSCLGQGSNGGGGDATIVTGTGVTFRFEAGSAGFVSTHEVTAINLTAPGLAAQLSFTAGVPLLFDMENSGTIHLDSAPPSGGKSSRFTGVVYQTTAATTGGVEINPGLAGSSSGALAGQVLAYSFNTFGQNGEAIDFSQGYGTASTPVIGTSGHNETEMLTSSSFTDLGNGRGQFQVKYTDEWALDAYDAYVKVNGGNPIFFSQGIWNSSNVQNPPPNPNTPGDSNPAYPDPRQDLNGAYAKTTTGGLPDWTISYSDGSTFETSGNWTWGHEADIPGAISTTNHATLTYTFQAPPGQTVDILIFMTDGDHCGDYVSASTTFNNVSTPQAGQQSSGSILLID